MDDKKHESVQVKSSEITPEHLYLSRREFLKSIGLVGAGALLAAACKRQGQTPSTTATDPLPAVVNKTFEPSQTSAISSTDKLGGPITSYEDITDYTNYYEFTINKRDVGEVAKDFMTTPWEVAVGGRVNKPRTFGFEDLLKLFSQEERIYRFRCVEAWSMVIPWVGFPLAKLLKEVEPMSDAAYVRFETLLDPEQMPGQKADNFPWPYTEGLRLDEAMHDLTILATGLYGKSLLPQNGAPIRVVIPWKYGFKSIKSIIKIELVTDQPDTFWTKVGPQEYGFYANVNPEVNHPRWSQATEHRIGEDNPRKTFLFNGYAEEVADLYKGMDLTRNFD
ncbi:MAG: protein-methionine-sulfoxide reductase catalytic subunit MsrP [Anaerolineales bacterium]|nr:protein-methionine-sulfoxide reductase catalytic subunit MsrP [Anaerolineales bacterium]